MKDDYDAVSAEIGAWLLCRVTGSRLFAAKLLLIVMLPLRAQRVSSGIRQAAVQIRLAEKLAAVRERQQSTLPPFNLTQCLVRLVWADLTGP